MTILMPLTKTSRNYSLSSIEEMKRNGNPWRNSLYIIIKMILIFWTDSVLKFLVFYEGCSLKENVVFRYI